MADLIHGIEATGVRARLADAHERIAAAARVGGRTADDVEVLVAVKYVPTEDLPVLVQAGVGLVGENRAQALVEKVAAPGGEGLRWDFIGQLQSRRVKDVLPHVDRIHSLASESALARLERHADLARSGLEILVEVDVAGAEGKAGIAPQDLPEYLERCPFPVVGLMTMPPFVEDPEENRRWFAALAELAGRHDLRQLSMGTSQDYAVAVQEGATVVRLGGALLR